MSDLGDLKRAGLCLPLIAFGGVDLAVGAEPSSLTDMVKQAFNARIRRIGRFIQLSLVGAADCIGTRDLPKNVDVYLASGAGDMSVTEDVLERIVRLKQPPKPLSFINTVSNATCFYLARQFGFTGASSIVSRRRLPLQAALRTAFIEARTGAGGLPLVGSVEEGTSPMDVHKRRVEPPPGAVLHEGSWWFLFEQPCQPDNMPDAAIAAMTSVSFLEDMDAVSQALKDGQNSALPTRLTVGSWLSEADIERLTRDRLDDITLPKTGWHDSIAGRDLADLLRVPVTQKTRLLHLDREPDGAFALVEFVKHPDPA
ncbi:hypothetical protein [Henriciella litoralis]|uniref:hypothetical protein n=1 Tax=Henriciella litoralis TaxID=568102 RepID=UPI0009FDA35E|nr:hypothetical protein [Henriciella litoralis]